jgi:hypothetical protein
MMVALLLYAFAKGNRSSRGIERACVELQIDIPQVREAAETFASKLFPRTPKLLRSEPLKALVIGAFVRGLSMRDVESLCEQAELGKLSKTTASRICEELRELRGVQAPQPLRHPRGGAVPRRDLHLRSSQRTQGGRARRLGIQRGRRGPGELASRRCGQLF